MTSRTLKMDRVLATHDMVGYLQSKGMVPVPDVRGRVKFCCPLHRDKTPSFVVFPPGGDDPYQSFFCFGCRKGGTFVHLMSEMEGISFREALAKLGDGLGIDLSDESQYVIERIRNRVEEDRREDEEMEVNFLCASRAVFKHVEATGRDPAEVEGCERMLTRLDDAFAAHDATTVDALAAAIPEVLGKRLRARAEAAEREEREAVRVYASMGRGSPRSGKDG